MTRLLGFCLLHKREGFVGLFIEAQFDAFCNCIQPIMKLPIAVLLLFGMTIAPAVSEGKSDDSSKLDYDYNNVTLKTLLPDYHFFVGTKWGNEHGDILEVESYFPATGEFLAYYTSKSGDR